MTVPSFNVSLRIRQRRNKDEKIITRENLIKIKQFILQHGKRKTYCSMYNNNPAYETKEYLFFLNPDTGQQNINCDPNKSDFHNLRILKVGAEKNQYRTVAFLDKHYVIVSTSWPTENLTILQIRQFVEDAMKEIETEIHKKRKLFGLF